MKLFELKNRSPVPEGTSAGLGFVLLVCGVTGPWIDLGTIHRWHNADSLLPVLVSLQSWTPFFWEQNRYGMLVPLLTRPITEPYWNLLAQGFVDTTCGLATFFLLARYTLRDATYPIVGGVAAVAFLALAPKFYQFDYLIAANYGAWMAPGLGALILAEFRPGGPGRVRMAAALLLVILANWVSFGTGLYLGPLVVTRAVFGRWGVREAGGDGPADPSPWGRLRAIGRWAVGSETVRALTLLAIGSLVGMQLMQLAEDQPTSFQMFSYAEWPDSWRKLVETTWTALAPQAWPLFLGVSAVAGLGWLLSPRVRRHALASWRGAAALAAAAPVSGLFLGTCDWVRMNHYVSRYLIPSVLLLQAAPVMIAIGPPCAAIGARARRWLTALALPALLLTAATHDFGWPSPRGVRADLDRFGALTPDLLAAGCTHLAGDYWTVWPAIFHANLTLRERGEDRMIWGVTFRALPSARRYRDLPASARCVGVPIGDPFGDNWLSSFGFPLMVEVERLRTIRVLRAEDSLHR